MEAWNLNGILVSKTHNCQWTISTISTTQSSDARIPCLLHEAGMNHASAVWKLGEDVICKVKLLIPGTTLEHVTLKHVRQQKPSFIIPQVYHHEMYEGRYYLITSFVSGITLAEAWPKMTDTTKRLCATQLATICTDMSTWPCGSQISGVDGRHLSERFLSASKYEQTTETLTPDNLKANCAAIGMDCTTLAFYHCDLGPENIILEPGIYALVAIIDWETAGNVPRTWIRTRFMVSAGMDLNGGKMDEWREYAQLALKERAFDEAEAEWRQWRKSCYTKP